MVKSILTLSTKVGIWITEQSGIQIVESSPISEWFIVQIKTWILDKSPVFGYLLTLILTKDLIEELKVLYSDFHLPDST